MADEPHFKVVMLGDSGVGKTALVNRISEGVFNEAHVPTVGSQFIALPLEVNKRKMTLELWDTAGQERYRSILPLYTQNSSGILLVFDISSSQPLQYIHHWLEYIKENVSKKIPIFLVGNKYDLLYEQVDFPELTVSISTVVDSL